MPKTTHQIDGEHTTHKMVMNGGWFMTLLYQHYVCIYIYICIYARDSQMIKKIDVLNHPEPCTGTFRNPAEPSGT